MCFSAQVSFALAAVLAAAGYMSLQQVRHKAFRMAAWVPIFFAMQQCAEGLLWLALQQGWNTIWVDVLPMIFMFFAAVIWPFWIPVSLYMIEYYKRIVLHVHNEKNLLGLWLESVFGSVLAIILLYLFGRYGFTATIVEHHIRYDFKSLPFEWPQALTLIYCIPVIGSFFISSERFFRIFGYGLLVFASISYVVWKFWFTSIWCFFAAVLSAGVVVYMRRQK